MRMRSLLSSAAFIATLMSTSTLVGDAYAQQRVMYDPATEWAVSRVSDKSGQGNDYCAMARRFKQNAILTFARNQDAQVSLALDFQKPLLTQGRSAPVTLDPGAGQQRVFEVTPVSTKAFVVRLGRDQAFFAALEKTGFLRVELNGKSYNFNLSDIEKGSFRLDACLASMVMPAAGDESPGDAGASTAPVSARREINSLRRQLNDLREENKRLSNLIESAAPALTPEPGAEMSGDAQALSERIETLQQDNEDLRGRIASVTSESEGLEEHLTKLLSENKSLQSQIDALSTNELTTIRDDKQQKKVDELMAENESLKKSLEIAAELDLDTLQAEVASLQKENEDLRVSLSDGASPDTQMQLEALTEENARLQAVITEQELTKSLVGELEEQITALEQEKVDVEAKLADLQSGTQTDFDAEIEKYRSENAELKASLEASKSSADLVEQLRKQIGQIENENRMLQEAATKVQDAEVDAAELEALSETHDEEIAQLEKTVAELKKDIAEKDAELVDVAQQSVDLEALKTRNAELETQLGESAAKQELLSSLESKVSVLEEENAQLKAELESAVKLAEVAPDTTLQEKFALLEAENQALKTKLEDQADSANESAQQTIADLQAENANLKAKISKANVAENDSGQLKDLQAENAQITSELEEAMLNLERYEVELTQKEEELSAALGEKTEILASMEDQGGALGGAAELQGALDELRSENSALKVRITELETAPSRVASLEAEVAQLKSDNKTLKDDLRKARSQIEALESTEASAQQVSTQAPPPVSNDQVKRIKELEQALREADIEKHEAMQALAKENARLKQDDTPLPMSAQHVSAPSPAPAPTAMPAQVQPEAEADSPEQGEIASSEPQPPSSETLVSVQEGPQVTPKGEVLDGVPYGRKPAVKEEPVETVTQDVAEDIAPPPVESEVVYTEEIMPEPASVEAEEGSAQPEPQAQEAQETAQQDFAPQYASAPEGLTEAQRLEREMSAQIDRGMPVIEPVSEEPIEVSASADPYADIEIEEQPMRYEGEENAAPAQESISWNEPVAAESQSELRSPAPIEISRASPPAPEPAERLSDITIEQMLSRAEVTGPQNIRFIEEVSGPEKAVYQWQTNQVFGSAELEPLVSEAQFDQRVQSYLEKTQARCPGEFAIVPDRTMQDGETRIDTYEVACVGTSVSSAASLMFFNQGGTFTAMAHEAPTQDMDAAMDIRDRLLRTISGS